MQSKSQISPARKNLYAVISLVLMFTMLGTKPAAAGNVSPSLKSPVSINPGSPLQAEFPDVAQSSVTFQWPTRGVLYTLFNSPSHQGLDILAPAGAGLGTVAVYPAYPGTVSAIWTDYSRPVNGTCTKGAGIASTIVIYHPIINRYSLYMHMGSETENVSYITPGFHLGDPVYTDTLLGYMGNRKYDPCSTWEKQFNPTHHLHFAVMDPPGNSGKYGIDPSIYYPGFQLNAAVADPTPRGTVVTPAITTPTRIRVHAVTVFGVPRDAKLAISRDNFRWDIIKQLDVTIKADGWSDPIQLDGVPIGLYTFYLKPRGALGEQARVLLNSYTNTIDIDFSPNGKQLRLGDANGDNKINMVDLEVWRHEVFDLGGLSGELRDTWRADYNLDRKASLIDFEIWRGSLFDFPPEYAQGAGWPESTIQSVALQVQEIGSSGPAINLLAAGSHNVGDVFPVQIELDTLGIPTSGTELMLRYDPGVLEVIDSNPDLPDIQIQAGTVYSTIASNLVDSEKGIIWFSTGTIQAEEFFTGTAVLATIQFRALASIYQTEVSVYYSPNWTTDSNVTARSLDQDQLQQVGNAVFGVTGDPPRLSPSVSIQADYDNYQPGWLQLVVEASDPYGQVQSVDFYAYYDDSWHLLGTDPEAQDGWIFDWDTSGIGDQDVWFYATSIIHGGASYDSELLYHALDQTSPSLVWFYFSPESPANTDLVSAWVEATDAFSGVDHIEMFYNTAPDGSDSGDWLYIGEVAGSQGWIDWDTSALNLTNGDYRVAFLIKDMAGNWSDGISSYFPYIIYGFHTVLTNSYASTGSADGWILESTETSSRGGIRNSSATTFRLGDDAADRQYRAILSFDTSALPDTAIITGATLQIKRRQLVGTNPFTTHGALKIDMHKPFFGAIAGLALDDFGVLASRSAVAAFGRRHESGWYSAILDSPAYSSISRTGKTQFRLRFGIGDNDDLSADYLELYSGEAGAAYRPVLIINYWIP